MASKDKSQDKGVQPSPQDPNLQADVTEGVDDTEDISTGYDCALCDEPNDADVDMIKCQTKCRRWFHFKCAGVKKAPPLGIRWFCDTCIEDGHVSPEELAVSAVVDKVTRFADMLPPRDVNLQKKKVTWGNPQDDIEKQHQKEMGDMKRAYQRQLEREREKYEMQLNLEREMLELRKQVEEEYQLKRMQLYQEYGQHSDERAAGGQIPADVLAGPSTSTPISTGQKSEFNPNPQQNGINGQTTPVRKPDGSMAHGDQSTKPPNLPPFPVPAVPNPGLPGLPPPGNGLPPLPPPGNGLPPFPIPGNGLPTHLPPGNGPPYPPAGGNNALPHQVPQQELTRAQISARRGPFAKLPIFTGEVEDWPIFYSNYVNGNAACNWSNLENLGRLQDAIQGKAKIAVGKRLVIPELVPTVIEELRDLYGRPEHLLRLLVDKAKKVGAPRFGNPESFNEFGIVVKQLRDHISAVGLVHHLTNPFLIAEMVSKLPHVTQTEWVRYSRGKEMSLVTFAEFITVVVADVNEAALISSLAESPVSTATGTKPKEPRPNQKRSTPKEQGFLNAHLSSEQTSRKSKVQQRNNDSFSRTPCRGCNRQDHRVRYCDDFKKMDYAERMKLVDKWKLCLMCLNEHSDSHCRFKGHCDVGSCKERHSRLLHPPAARDGTQVLTGTCNIHEAELDHPVIFRVVPIRIHNGRHTLEVIAFLDEGSSFSLMDDSVAKHLKLKGAWRPILVNWTAGMSRLERDSRSIDVTISAKGSAEEFLLKNVHTVDQLRLPEQTTPFKEVAARFKHLRGLPIEDDLSGPPRILIGLKHLHVYAPLESRIGQPGEPIVVRSKLGWTVYGPQNNSDEANGFAGLHSVTNLADHDLRTYFTLEESPAAGQSTDGAWTP